MTMARVVSSAVACAAVGGCAVLAIGMAHAATRADARRTESARPSPSATSRPAYLPTTQAPLLGENAATQRTSATAKPTPRATHPTTSARPAPSTSHVAVPTTSAAPTPAVPRPTTQPAAVTHAAPTTHHAPAAPRPAPHRAAAPVHHTIGGQALPSRYSVGNATRVITVTAHSHGSTTATLQAWTKLAPGHWKKYGGAITAHLGSDGIGSASETRSKTPEGSFTLTQAFGHNSDPGTSLPYFKTNPSDYWISDGGSKYNTHQRCGHCGYNDGVNERLYYETPYYNYAVVIDYNTRNAPGGVHQGKGSAFFLHVTDGKPTAGCVAIGQSQLISLMRWLTPSTHPRIVIQVT